MEGAGIQPTSAIRPEGRHGQPSTPHQFSHLPRKCACSGGKCQWPNLEPEEIKLFEIILILQLYLPFWTNSSGRLGRPKPGYCHEQRLHRQQCSDTFLSVLGSLAPVIKWGKMRRGTVTPSQERGSRCPSQGEGFLPGPTIEHGLNIFLHVMMMFLILGAL